MSYTTPTQTEISSIGLDAAITALQIRLKTIAWLSAVFHRAYTHREIGSDGKSKLFPKVWEAENEWYNCLPNDNFAAQAFFTPISEERVTSFEKYADATFEQDVALIVWGNIDRIAGHFSGPSLGYEKADVINILKDSDSVLNINEIIDRSATEIYQGFTIADEQTHYTMLPFAGFRINFTVKFDYIDCPIASS